MICQNLIPLPNTLCNVIYIQKDIVRGNAYMEKQQTYSRDETYIYQYLGLLRRMLHERSQSDWNQMSHLLTINDMSRSGISADPTPPPPLIGNIRVALCTYILWTENFDCDSMKLLLSSFTSYD